MASVDWAEMDDSGFICLVGPIFYRFDNGLGHFKFMAEDKHGNRSGNVHGGMLLTFADRSLGYTARQRDMSRKQATVQLNMHFIRGVSIGELVEMECRVVRETRSLVFLDGAISQRGETAATAHGVWKIIRQGT
jgi:uncharacterized protein (TIGR00369 family)